MRILLTTESFRPEAGGPAVSVSRLALELAHNGAEVGLWSPDGSALTSDLVQSATGLTRLGRSLAAALDPVPDIVHDNGIWRYYHHRVARLCHRGHIPRIVSVRGMLEPWALAQRRPKKMLAWAAYQRRDLERAAWLHATAPQEAAHVSRFAAGAPVATIANGVDLPDAKPDRPASPHQRTALFLSRIHPKKGLPMLLEAWARLRVGGWRLLIVGPSERGHGADVEALVARLGLRDSVSLLGPRYGPEKDALLRSADLFVLPSHSENFGMAVAEALAHGVPVLTTTGTPWKVLAERACGWCVDPTPRAIEAALRRALHASAGELREMGRRGRRLIASDFGWASVGADFMALYEDTLNGRGTRA
jgi:glycosyltransferase involved in cell wall biosynthesis